MLKRAMKLFHDSEYSAEDIFGIIVSIALLVSALYILFGSY